MLVSSELTRIAQTSLLQKLMLTVHGLSRNARSREQPSSRGCKPAAIYPDFRLRDDPNNFAPVSLLSIRVCSDAKETRDWQRQKGYSIAMNSARTLGRTGSIRLELLRLSCSGKHPSEVARWLQTHLFNDWRPRSDDDSPGGSPVSDKPSHESNKSPGIGRFLFDTRPIENLRVGQDPATRRFSVWRK